MLSLLNAHRASIGVGPLTLAGSLVASAEYKSMNMAGYSYMAHDDPAPVARSIADRFVACGYPSNAGWGENIAWGFVDAQSVMNAWLSDSGHKYNIESPSWSTVGIGVAKSSDGFLYWTQDFGTTGGGGGGGGGGGPDNQAPSVPSGLSASAASQTAVNFSWTASTDNVWVAGYDVYLNGGLLGTTTVTLGTIGGLTCGTTYTVGVDAFDAAGNKSAIASKSVSTQSCGGGGGGGGGADTKAPSVPSGLSSTGATQTSVSLSWQPSTDDTAVTGYGLYLNGGPAGTTKTASGTIAGLACGKTYTVGVDAFDAAGNHSAVASTSVSTQACPPPPPPPPPPVDTQAPSAPDGLVAAPATRQAVTLDWNPATDDTKLKGYTVYVNGAAVKTVGPNWTNARTNGLTCGTTYTVGVDAFDADGNHSSITTTTVTTPACKQFSS